MHRTISMYVVQKRWMSGSPPFDPVDYQRLFVTPDSAQILAYQSAHSLAEATQQSVRTISMSANSYGFAVANALFWIRRVDAVVVGSYSSPNNQYEAHTLCWNETVGDSRPQPQQDENPSTTAVFVFVGDGAFSAAQQHAVHDPLWKIRRMPIGPAPSEGWKREWPLQAVGENANNHNTAKRMGGDAIQQDKMRTWSAVVTEQPAAKRRCTKSPTSTTDQAMDWQN